jgi:glycosyltransferase involved in cell wall biosynthesis
MHERRVAMVQLGARRNYTYARQLEREGLLAYLMTDAAWVSQPRNIFAEVMTCLVPRLTGPITRRTVFDVSPARLRSSFIPNLAGFTKWILHEETAFELIDEAFAFPNKLRGLGSVDIVVNYMGNGGSFLNYAKKRGATIVTDFISMPSLLEIETAERQRWAGWETATASPALLAHYRRRISRLVHLSDIYLCPSQNVAFDLASIEGFDASKVRLVPYGSSGVLSCEPRPVEGRVLFAGTAKLLKGIAYLAEAARILKVRSPLIKIVIAGTVSEATRSRSETRDLEFLGHIGTQRMSAEYARADIFCLPSLAEGSATSIFEALAYGLPVVTTLSSGSVVRDGQEGIIVPERDGKAIATAIEAIVSDRQKRSAMSRSAFERAAEYDDARCGADFIAVIEELMVSRAATKGGMRGL